MKRRRIHLGFFQRLNSTDVQSAKKVLMWEKNLFCKNLFIKILKRPFFSNLSMILIIEQIANLQKDK